MRAEGNVPVGPGSSAVESREIREATGNYSNLESHVFSDWSLGGKIAKKLRCQRRQCNALFTYALAFCQLWECV